MKTMKTILLSLFIILFVNTSLAQITKKKLSQENKENIVRLNDSIIKLRNVIINLNKQIDDGKETKNKAETVYETANKIFNIKDMLITWFFPFLIAVLSLFGIGFFSKQIVSKVTNSSIKEINRLATNERWGIDLRNSARVIIINKIGTKIKPEVDKITDSFHNKVKINMANLDVKSFQQKLKSKNITLNKNELNVLIIDDNIENISTADGMNSFIDYLDKNNIGILLYGSGRINKEYELKGFANNPSTLYGNLMNLLKYMSIFKN